MSHTFTQLPELSEQMRECQRECLLMRQRAAELQNAIDDNNTHEAHSISKDIRQKATKLEIGIRKESRAICQHKIVTALGTKKGHCRECFQIVYRDIITNPTYSEWRTK